ncbi:LysM peptidoglycan-binding domain-containing protein [Polyangium mundeleinium]|uniref:LysM peptidoglycan-binding domain-containing protein n=1 Tax=Polyangium mundeleinium TaxID=2995306 RepID=A0ABT5EKH6_9BACT|nr:LysM peptidoglycan-binding domain-containing protein [Polyangium mundeleinium]MDC0742343.1 LysM peptidoglycan-binding domain-containing protein [Polyangium mundeleinium]
MKDTRALAAPAIVLLSLAAAGHAGAQDGSDAAPAPGGAQVTIVQAPQAPQTQVVVPGYPQPGYNPDAHLPSSSRSTLDTSRASDGFDLVPDASASETVRGTANGGFVLEGQHVPELHSVRTGDTLWDISTRYYKNPYGWPRLWAQNPQIQNPHWIYPGDQVRLRDAGDRDLPGMRRLLSGTRKVAPQTIFLRDTGWLDNKKDDVWGEIDGSPADKMLLSAGDDVYVKLDEGHEVAVGQLLTIFRPLVTSGDAAQKGQLVSIRGTLRVDRINTQTRMVRGRIVESLDTVERGAKIGPIDRSFVVVPPVASADDIEARIVAALYPHAFYGQNQVVFLDKGEKEGVKQGMRFFALRRGDRWRHTLRGAGKFATVRPVIEDDRAAQTENFAPPGDESLFPDETYAELRVVKVREHTATALVTASSHEIERGAFVTARKGY